MWWTEPAPWRPGRKSPTARIVTNRRARHPLEPDRAALGADFLEAQHTRQDRRGRSRLAQEQGDAVEAADRLLGAMSPTAQAASASAPSTPTSASGIPSGSRNRSTVSPKTVTGRVVRHVHGDEAVGPGADRGFRHPERRLRHLTDADPAGAACAMGKKVRIVPGVPASSPK